MAIRCSALWLHEAKQPNLFCVTQMLEMTYATVYHGLNTSMSHVSDLRSLFVLFYSYFRDAWSIMKKNEIILI